MGDKSEREAFLRLAEMIRGAYGIDLRRKQTLVEGRLARMLAERGFDTLEAYLPMLEADPRGEELIQVLNRLTTNHTYFMREAEHFNHFKTKALPEIAKMATDGDIRVWSAGCSTGQEPYTLFMILDEFFSRLPGKWEYSVLATDISHRALSFAREGVYDAEELSGLPAEWKRRYLRKHGDGMLQFSDAVRDGVIYRPFNLMEEKFPFRRPFHVIFCRNVMIYFEAETKTRLVGRFVQNTVPGGYLYIGQTESVARGVSGYRYVMPAVYRKEG